MISRISAAILVLNCFVLAGLLFQSLSIKTNV